MASKVVYAVIGGGAAIAIALGIKKAYESADLGAIVPRAASIIRSQVPDITPAGVQMALGVALGEGTDFGFASSWRNADGSPSYNVGCVMARSGEPSITHGDRDESGKKITAKFRSYANLEEGISGFLKAWGKPNVLSAAKAGDTWQVAAAMKSNRYYTGVSGSETDRIRAYAKMIQSGAERAAKYLSEPSLVRLNEPSTEE